MPEELTVDFGKIETAHRLVLEMDGRPKRNFAPARLSLAEGFYELDKLYQDTVAHLDVVTAALNGSRPVLESELDRVVPRPSKTIPGTEACNKRDIA